MISFVLGELNVKYKKTGNFMPRGNVQTVHGVSVLLGKVFILDNTTVLPLHNDQYNLCYDIYFGIIKKLVINEP